jgi:hypothetical protein
MIWPGVSLVLHRISRGAHSPREIVLVRAVVEELLARDLIILDGIDTDFFEGAIEGPRRKRSFGNAPKVELAL